MSTILLVEDNRAYAETLKSNLEREGYEVTMAVTGVDGLAAAKSTSPDLIILDLMLPTMNGFTVLQRLRDEGHETPVLVMTALGTEEEKLRGFGLGADDYVVKPCGLLEILARVKALLKRAAASNSEPRLEVQVDDLTIDFGARAVRRGKTELTLRPKGSIFSPRSCATGVAWSLARNCCARCGATRPGRRAGRSRRISPRCASGWAMIRRVRDTS